jgi:hypothetical protein
MAAREDASDRQADLQFFAKDDLAGAHHYGIDGA